MDRKEEEVIQGAKGGGTARTPVEAPNTLRSIAYARIVDLLSEGPIVGLVDGLKSVYLDETPVQNANDSMNFKSVQIDTRVGTADQDYIPGFPEVENGLAVNVQLTNATPYTRAFTNLNLSAVRVTLYVNALYATNTSNGDVRGNNVAYAFDIATDGGPFQTVLTGNFQGKTMSKYERSHRIDLPKATDTGWILRVRRISGDSSTSSAASDTFVGAVTEIIDAKLRYPMSAIAAISMDASQFQNIPSRAYDVKGRIVRVPVNYNPETREYTGVWNGTFKLAWTDNPAWCYYDLATHPRYGLGQQIGDALVNKWALYEIAQYCDELVPDGLGGLEPRFTCNLYLQSQSDAYKIIQDMSSIFRGLSYWAAGQINPVADKPSDPVYTYTPANVVDGEFSYTGSPKKTRYTTALVSWNDRTSFGRSKVEYVDDPEGIMRYGIQQTDMTGVGCASQGQAQRVGRYALISAQYETDLLTFTVGLDGAIAAPGQIIRVSDPKRTGRRSGGRVIGGTAIDVQLDGALESNVEVGDTITVIMPTALSETRTIATIATDRKSVTVSSAFSDIPVKGAVWMVETEEVQATLYRVVAVTEAEDLKYQITAVEHFPSKFDAIDNGTRLETPPVTDVPGAWQLPPTNIEIAASEIVGPVATNTVLDITWDEPSGAVEYDVEIQVSDQSWTPIGKTTTSTTTITTSSGGVYVARVRAINANGIYSVPAYSAPTSVAPPSLPPAIVTDIIDTVTEVETDLSQEIIDRVNGDAALATNLATGLADEAAARAADIAAEVLARNSAITSAVADEASARGAAIAVEEAARIAADSALAASITALGAASQFEPNVSWEFVSSVETWIGTQSTVTNVGETLRMLATGSQPAVTRNSLAIDGTKYNLVRARVRRITPASGTGSWLGTLLYSTSGHGYTSTYNKNIPKPAGWDDGKWCVVEWDMSTLTAGGTDWTTNTITGLQLFTEYSAVAEVEYDWIAVGKNGAGLSSAAFNSLETRVTATEGTNTTQATQLTNLETRMTTAEGNISGQATAISGLDARVTTAEGTITSQSTQLTNLSAGLDMSFNQGMTVSFNSTTKAIDKWVRTVGGTVEVSYPAETTATGGTVIRVGNNSGNDTVWARHTQWVPFDATKSYRLRGRYRRVSGTGSVYIGLACVTADKSQYVNQGNVLSGTLASSHYSPQVNGVTPALGVWQTFETFYAGRAAGAATGAGTSEDPRLLANQVAWITPMFIANYDNLAGEVEFDFIALEDADAVRGNRSTATALTALDARVTTAEGTITTQASQITNLRATMGGGSGNLLPNAGLENGLSGWSKDNSTIGSSLLMDKSVGFATGSGDVTNYYIPRGTTALQLRVPGVTVPNGNYGQAFSENIPVQVGKPYMASTYINNYRCQAVLIIAWYNSAGTYLSENQVAQNPMSLINPTMAQMARINIKATAPTNAVYARVVLRMWGNGGNDPYIWFCRPMLEEATTDQTVPSAWNNSSVGMEARSASALSTLDARVTTAEGTITSQGSAITSLTSSLAGKADVSAVTALTTRVAATETTGNGNMLSNTAFLANLNGWTGEGDIYAGLVRDAHGTAWQPPAMHSAVLFASNGGTIGTSYSSMTQIVPVEEGKVYVLSAYLAAHRANAGVQITFLNASGGSLGSVASEGAVVGAGQSLASNYTRRYVAGTAPANSTHAKIWIFMRKSLASPAGDEPYVWVVRPQFEEARSGQTIPTTWNAGGVEMSAAYTLRLDVNGHVTGWNFNNDGTTGNFSIVADNFAIVSPSGGARTEYSGGNWRVYDAAGTLRVRLGVWT